MSIRDRSTTTNLTQLSPTVFHILLSLADGERHGYALKREIALRTGGKLKRYYRITAHGRKAAQAEAARMRNLVELAVARFGLPKHA